MFHVKHAMRRMEVNVVWRSLHKNSSKCDTSSRETCFTWNIPRALSSTAATERGTARVIVARDDRR
ncbi:hypothetical protein CMS3110 [Clavibacter sepedonicus]|uniref:Uncharacterized protein n=1 Tax=Clavibacter sepedonicus TaxID=31964 RepID=B0RDP9_CLASE|nr:hypothetical protein CMS3110 [Clavibacter sepedonicus]